MTVTFIQYFAAALVIIGSGLVLRAVWLADAEPSAPGRIRDASPRSEMPDLEDWREAA
jgi:hypothetical protein